MKSTKIWVQQIIKHKEVLNYIALIKNDHISLAFNVHVKYSPLTSATSSSQQRMYKKLAQFQAEDRHRQEEVARHANSAQQPQPRHANSAQQQLRVTQHTVPLMNFLSYLLHMLTW